MNRKECKEKLKRLKKGSHDYLILTYLLSHKGITKMDIITKFGCTNPGGRIFDLRQMSIPIETDMVTNKKTGKQHAVYRLEV